MACFLFLGSGLGNWGQNHIFLQHVPIQWHQPSAFEFLPTGVVKLSICKQWQLDSCSYELGVLKNTSPLRFDLWSSLSL